MKTLTILLSMLFSIGSFGQLETESDVLISSTQNDDVYRAGETVKANASIQGDLVIAGGNLTVNDSIHGDLTAAGGELFLNGYVADDVRIAVGRATIDSEIGDDLIVFGGEVILTENSIIHGNLKCFAGSIEMMGQVLGKLEVKASDVLIDGAIGKSSKIVGEEITIGSNAKFYKEVEYWNDAGELEFENSLVNAEARFNEDFGEEESELSITTFGTKSPSLWIFYILSAFLVILVFHALFKNAFSKAVDSLEGNWLRCFGFGLIYLFGIPLFIIVTFLMIVGIPLSLFVTTIFVFSLFFGHLIAAILIVYYLRHKKNKNWGFLSITFLALGFAIILRLLTLIPYGGILFSAVILSITYGALTLQVLHSKKTILID